jgi:hypothetical protein
VSEDKKSNVADGRTSFDISVGNVLIPFFNRNVSTYPTEAGGPKFDLIPVEKQKDLMVNHARMYAQQEYDRIMELVTVLQRQAEGIKRRLDITDMVHVAEYQFQVVMGNLYWIVLDHRRNKMLLLQTGPKDWTTGAPEDYEYISQVKYMGDHTWLEVKENEDGIV